ncbi:MAG: MarR family transcriptional regulator [Chloroflexi bacterium]|nr:MarR family transcriptional regulator [Chloroflexota bacterium]
MSKSSEQSASEPAELVASTGYLLARLGMESRRLWGQMLADFGLTPHDFGVLMMLGRVDSASQQQLGQLVGVDPRNLVALVDALEARQLVRRQPDPTDRRRYAVALTRAGRRMLNKLTRAGEQLEQELLRDLTDEERASLRRVLARLFESRVTGSS